jgi:hypothetical protein
MPKEYISQFFDNENIKDNDLKKIIKSVSVKNKLWQYQLISDALDGNHFLQDKQIYNNISKHIKDKEPCLLSSAKKIFNFNFQANYYAIAASLFIVLSVSLLYFYTPKNYNSNITTMANINTNLPKHVKLPFFMSQRVKNNNLHIKGIPDDYKILWSIQSYDERRAQVVEHRLYSNGKTYFSLFINKNQSFAIKPTTQEQTQQTQVNIIDKNNHLITLVNNQDNDEVKNFINKVSME